MEASVARRWTEGGYEWSLHPSISLSMRLHLLIFMSRWLCLSLHQFLRCFFSFSLFLSFSVSFSLFSLPFFPVNLFLCTLFLPCLGQKTRDECCFLGWGERGEGRGDKRAHEPNVHDPNDVQRTGRRWFWVGGDRGNGEKWTKAV